ncbi:hypothetical protein GCM10027591_10920 [Zhihengliuella somnathii]
MRLAVELYGTVIGHLEGEGSRTFDFAPSPEGIEAFGRNSHVLSFVLPLSPKLPRHHAGRRRNWFAELLPEGNQLDYMLAQAGLRRSDVLGFLSRFGRDVAGAVQLWDVEDPTEPKAQSARPLSDGEVRQLLEDPMGSPLGNRPSLGKTSLQGVQPKIVLAAEGGVWKQCLGGYASTHILKPEVKHRPSLIFDEEYGLRLARRLGLNDFDAEIQDFDGLNALVIERYDRESGRRVHQEDFSQVLGAEGNQKYQEFGGLATLVRMAEALRRHISEEQLRQLAQLVVFSVGIGNLDLHTKNVSILHPEGAPARLAPAYDTVPMAQYVDADGRLALAVNGKYDLKALEGRDLITELSTWGLRSAQEIVHETLGELSAAVSQEVPLDGASPALQEHLQDLIRHLRP